MKKIIALLLTVIIIFSSVTLAFAENLSLKNYTPTTIVRMYPEVAAVIIGGVLDYEEEIDLNRFNLTENQLAVIYESTLFENPDIFYVNPFIVDYTMRISDGFIATVRPTYIFPVEEIPLRIAEFEDATNYFLKGVDPDWSGFRKCRYIHDMLATNVEYDVEYSNTKPVIYSAYGALVNNVAVCQGYVLAYNFLMSRLGIESKFIESSNYEHSWSMVKLGNNYYHVDITWDDPTEDLLGRAFHTYCLISDNKLKELRPEMNWVADHKATATRYDNAWWKKIETFIYTVSGKDYYIDHAYGAGRYGGFLCYDEADGSHTLMQQIKDRWYVGNTTKYWSSNFSNLAYDGTKFYYNTPDSVISTNLNGKNKKCIFHKPATQSNDIYGVLLSRDGKMRIAYQKDPVSAGFDYVLTDMTGNYSLGDVNTDRVLNIKDVTRLQKHLNDAIRITSFQVSIADTTQDGQVDVRDATKIQKQLAKKD